MYIYTLCTRCDLFESVVDVKVKYICWYTNVQTPWFFLTCLTYFCITKCISLQSVLFLYPITLYFINAFNKQKVWPSFIYELFLYIIFAKMFSVSTSTFHLQSTVLHFGFKSRVSTFVKKNRKSPIEPPWCDYRKIFPEIQWKKNQHYRR